MGMPVLTRSALGSRLSTSVCDQALSSATNFGLAAVAARWLAPSGFGAFAVALSVASFGLALQRGLVGEPLLAYCSEDSEDALTSMRNGIRTAVLGSLVGAALAVVIALAAPPIARDLLYLGYCLPVLLTQDALRYAAFARTEPGRALLSDSLWAITELVMVPVAWHFLGHRASSLFLAWAVGAAVAIVPLAVRYAGYQPLTVSAARTWLTSTRELSHWLFAQVLLSHVIIQAVLLTLAARFGAAAAGGYRATQTLVMPIAVAMTGAQAFLVPHAIRAGWAQRGSRVVLRLSLLLASLVVPVALCAWLVAPAVVRVVYGAEYAPYSDMLPLFAAALTIQASGAPLVAVLRARRDGRGLFGVQVAAAVVGALGITVVASALTAFFMAVVYLLMSAALAITSAVRVTNASSISTDRAITSEFDAAVA